MMRFPFFIALVFFIIIGVGYWYQSTAYICPAPLAYRFGDFDDSFAISRDEAIAEITLAERLWEDATGRELFTYSDDATFTVNFIFDERQQESDGERAQRRALDEKRDQNDKLFVTIESLQRDYEALGASYRNEVATYEARLTEYNDEVRQYNDQGGAPESTFAELEDERVALNRELTRLNADADELNTLGTRLNELAERGNREVEIYNRAVNTYNEQFGHAHEFTQGDYQGDKINIYEFSNRNELRTVLVHELGHALGIDHIDDAEAVMYYLLEDTESAPMLAPSDLVAYTAVCGTGSEWDHSLRRSIRAVLHAF